MKTHRRWSSGVTDPCRPGRSVDLVDRRLGAEHAVADRIEDARLVGIAHGARDRSPADRPAVGVEIGDQLRVSRFALTQLVEHDVRAGEPVGATVELDPAATEIVDLTLARIAGIALVGDYHITDIHRHQRGVTVRDKG